VRSVEVVVVRGAAASGPVQVLAARIGPLPDSAASIRQRLLGRFVAGRAGGRLDSRLILGISTATFCPNGEP